MKNNGCLCQFVLTFKDISGKSINAWICQDEASRDGKCWMFITGSHIAIMDEWQMILSSYLIIPLTMSPWPTNLPRQLGTIVWIRIFHQPDHLTIPENSMWNGVKSHDLKIIQHWYTYPTNILITYNIYNWVAFPFTSIDVNRSVSLRRWCVSRTQVAWWDPRNRPSTYEKTTHKPCQ